SLEEQLDVIVQADVEAQRYINEVCVSRIAIVIAVSDAECKLASPKRVAIVDREQASRSTNGTASAHCGSLITWILRRPQSLRRHRGAQKQSNERGNMGSGCESHRIPPA